MSTGTSFGAAREIVGRLTVNRTRGQGAKAGIFNFSDEEQDKILQLIDTLDDRVFGKTNRNAWKLRMFFKPSDVVGYLISRGATHNLFYKSS